MRHAPIFFALRADSANNVAYELTELVGWTLVMLFGANCIESLHTVLLLTATIFHRPRRKIMTPVGNRAKWPSRLVATAAGCLKMAMVVQKIAIAFLLITKLKFQARRAMRR
jgi:hypothetical protein